MKTSELTGSALNWAVAMAEGWQHTTAQDNGRQYPWLAKDGKYQDPKNYRPSSNWMQGGAIIERERIAVFVEYPKDWCATDGNHRMAGKTPLIAAMRCYVTSKLGDEVDVPKEILTHV